MDKIVINNVELTQEEFDLYKKGTSIDDIVKRREEMLTGAEKEKLTFGQKIAKLFKLIDAEDEAVTMYRYENGWYSANGYIELYIDIKDIEFNKNKTLNKIKLYINQDNNIFETVDLYGLDSLIEFLNDCDKWADKVKNAIDDCPF